MQNKTCSQPLLHLNWREASELEAVDEIELVEYLYDLAPKIGRIIIYVDFHAELTRNFHLKLTHSLA